MDAGRQKHTRQARKVHWACAAFAASLACLIGCTPLAPHVDKYLMADRGLTEREVGVAENYVVGCPDVLAIAIDGLPDFSRRLRVEPDGAVNLGPLGRPRVEGHSVSDMAAMIARQAGVAPERVTVRVAEFNSKELYLFGEVSGLQRSVPYRGQETVLDLLQRAGGITPGAAPEEVYVVRPHVFEGSRPEVFRVDLRAIVMKHDTRTNIRLEPFDHIHVGATPQARVEACIPPWLRPLYQALWDTRPEPAKTPNAKPAA
jgi:protein involved in polysaccharide export with SLBB domain